MAKFYRDDAYETYASKDDFIQRIGEVHANTEWIDR